jgi:mono/diheme cytochrome c family protein
MAPALRLLLLTLAAPSFFALPLAASAAPDARRGEALFVGSTRLAAGGAPCLACHGIAGHGLEHAASFGPDLSAAHEQFGAEALESALGEIAFPSMEPVYRGHAIRDDERADLIAFLGESTGRPPPTLGPGYAAGIAAAMAIFLALVLLVGRRGTGQRARAAAGRTP